MHRSLLLLLAGLAFPAAASADPVDLAELRDWHEATATIAIDADAPAFDAAGLVLASEPGTITVDRGLLFPIFAGDEPVGFGFVGTGTMAVEVPRRGARLRLANEQVTVFDVDRDELQAFVDGHAPFSTPITSGVVLTADPSVLALLDGRTPVVSDAHEGDPGAGADGGLAVMPEADFRRALRTARQALQDRLERTGFDAQLRHDLLGLARLDEDAARTLLYADFETGHRYGDAKEPWLALIRDASGTSDTHWLSEVVSIGDDVKGRTTVAHLTGVAHPVLDGAPTPAVHMAPVSADTTVTAAKARSKLSLDVQITSEITLEAVGGPIQRFAVRVPQHEEEPGSWALLALRVDGDDRPISWVAEEDEDFAGQSGRVRLVLPEPVAQGEQVTIVVQSEDTWPYGNVQTFGSMGRSSGLMDVIPTPLPARVGNPWRFTTRVGVRTGEDLTAALSGETLREWSEDGRDWVEAGYTEHTALWPNVAVGTWASEHAEAAAGMPAIDVHLFPEHKDTIDSFAPEIRRVVATFEQLLPPFPYQEVELFQAPSMFYGFVWIAPHGMVNLQATMVFDGVGTGESLFRNERPHLEAGVLAHELAHQYWGHVARPASLQDFWIAETFAEAYSCLYVANAFGPEAYDARLDSYRETWERDLPNRGVRDASLVHAYATSVQPDIVYKYGPYVFLEMLRPRIGDAALLSAMDQLLRDRNQQSVTTDDIRHALEGTSGEDLSDFFDYWVEGGFLPALELVGEREGATVGGEILSDVPFGTLEVPLVVAGRKTSQTHWVSVVDGRGPFEVELPKGATLELDPDGRVLASKRKVRIK